MSMGVSILAAKSLEDTIQVLCPIIINQLQNRLSKNRTEYMLRRELVSCILGSQVKHEMAIAATEYIEAAGLLDDLWWQKEENGFYDKVLNVLSGYHYVNQNKWRYRFPQVKANQLAQARDVIVRRPLLDFLSVTTDSRNLRRSLVKVIPGIGPKQASMFLRNVGVSYNLAILDTHIIQYMSKQKLIMLKSVKLGTINGYEEIESIFRSYADTLGYPVGFLDLAIWVTMRAAKELFL